MTESKYKERIEGAQEAIKRARLVFLILSIVSLAIIISDWNAYFSWDRGFATRVEHHWAKNDEVTQFAQQRLVDGWVHNQTIDAPLLGIHIGVSDVAPLGGIALFILSIWFFLSARRENHTIGLLLRDTRKEMEDVRVTIFHSILSHLVFLTIRPTDDPIDSLEESASTRGHSVVLRTIIKALFYLPVLAILAAFTCDLLSIFFFDAPFREGHQPLDVADIGASEWTLWGAAEGFTLILAVGTAVLSRRSLRFIEATSKILREYCAGFACGPQNKPEPQT